ncbi:MAG: LamG-like jellyroll fold domain-containing protein [Alphaproteobacteria bacterium]
MLKFTFDVRSILIIAMCTPVFDVFAEDGLVARGEVNLRSGSARNIMMTEIWAPLSQDENSVIYGDLRLMGDDKDNHEGNIGLGYRKHGFFGGFKGIVGAHGWLDRRITARGSAFNQVTAGVEWFGENGVDLRLNGYLPLSSYEEHITVNSNPLGFQLSGTGIVTNTNGRVIEEPQHGFDIELGLDIGRLFNEGREHIDTMRVYGGGYVFDSARTERVSGVRTRFTADITSDFQLGARFQHDNVRGSQGFLEATLRFPFGSKRSYRKHGLLSRLDESPERDIDIVTGEVVTDAGVNVAVINNATGQQQEILHVDNSAGAGGDGSVENPFNTLADAQAAASAQTIIYVNRGDGTSTNQDQGIALDKTGQVLIGSGVDFIYDTSRFSLANSESPSSFLIASANAAPLITNVNANGDGVRVSADDVVVTGITVDGAMRDGIVVEADGGAASAQNVVIKSVTLQNNRMGVYVHGSNGGAVSALVQNTVVMNNSQHGVAIYDDTNGDFEADLGGGALGSTGNNVLAGNTLEDLAVEYDGRALSAQNNWWGQASGPDTDLPTVGVNPQIYYGAPINDDLVGSWTFDTEWTTDTVAYDRSGQGNNGSLSAGISLADQVAGQNREALDFSSDRVDAGDIDAIDNTTAFTTAMWVKLDVLTGDRELFAKGSHGSDAPLIIWRDNSVGAGDQAGNLRTLSVIVNSTTNRTWISAPTDSLNDTGWHHVAVTYEGGDAAGLKIYMDGVMVQSGSTVNVTSIEPSGTRYTIGAPNNGTNFFDGLLDGSHLYTRALDSGEVAELYRMDTSSSVDTGGFLTSAP